MREILTFVLLTCVALALHAQSADPSPAQMIEQLKAPRTRSLRNLAVEAVPAAPTNDASAAAGAQTAAATPAARPSLSLLIQFDFNSARVRPESQQALSNLSQALQSTELLESRFAIEGHTDAKGSTEYNLKLSQQRAQAVRAFLLARGISDARLQAIGKGASELANSADPFAAENRRVRIVNLD